VIATAFIIFVLPYVLAVSGVVLNGTETLILVILLWAGSRWRAPKSTDR
jgi:hypothetical protein